MCVCWGGIVGEGGRGPVSLLLVVKHGDHSTPFLVFCLHPVLPSFKVADPFEGLTFGDEVGQSDAHSSDVNLSGSIGGMSGSGEIEFDF